MQTKRRLAVSDYEAPGGDVVEVIGVEDLLTSPWYQLLVARRDQLFDEARPSRRFV
jgi:hypothetical protein